MNSAKKIVFGVFLASLVCNSCREDERASREIHDQDNEFQSSEATSNDASDLQLSTSNIVLTKCPTTVQTGANSYTNYKTYLSQNACWYFSDTGDSCDNFCKKFYGVDVNAMNRLKSNSAMCQEVIKGINPQQAQNYKTGTSIMAASGSACAWVISGKFPNTVWYIVSQTTLNTAVKSPSTQQACACDTEGFPSYMNMGLSYRNATGTTGKKGMAMSIKPTYVTQKTANTPVFGPVECRADASTPLPAGLSFELNTCRIFGTPTVATSGIVKIKVNAYNMSNINRSESLYKSNDAYVTLTVAP